MCTTNKISSFRKFISLLFLLLASGLVAHAQTPVWDGVTVSATLNGEGTAERPYEVASGADLKLVQQDQKYWKADVYLLQIDDIDLGGHELGLIGYGDADKTGADINNSNFHPFFATYDGGAHKINHLLIYWDAKDSNHYSAGLFGLLAGTVRNLHLDSAIVTRSAEAVAKNHSCDMRIGVVAGAVAPNKNGDKQVRVENIIITNSTITDGGVATDLKTYFIGGVVGDVSSGYGSTNNISASNYGYVHIRNIYANINFDLSNSVRTKGDAASITQFDIGGIVGRMRRGKYCDLPEDVLFRGKVKAPLAAIAPYICMSRCNGDNTVNGMNSAYTGEVLSSNTTTSTSAFTKLTSDELKVAGEMVYPNENRFFYGYEIWDSKTGNYVEITNTFPTADINRNNIRTLEADGSQLTTTPTAEMMRSWQGVNHGSYANMKSNVGSNTVTDRLNSLGDPVKFAWDAENETFTFSANEQVSLTRSSLHTVAATIYNNNRSKDYIYTWTLTDVDGNPHTYETTKFTASTYSNDEAGITVDYNTCRFTMKEDFRNYTKATFTLYDELGNSLCSASIDLPTFGITLKRSTEKTDKVRYHFSPEFSFDDEDLATDNPVLQNSNISYLWEAYVWDGSQWVKSDDAIYSGANSPEVVVKQEFIGSVRLVITDSEIAGHPYYLTGDATVNYMEQKLERLRFSFSIKQMQWDAEGNVSYVNFNPSTYFAGSTGYPVTYTYDAGKTEGTAIVDQNGETHFLADDNTSGTLEDKSIPPLVFEGTVVDQFGNTVDYDPDKYRIQWSFRIPDSREVKDFPAGLAWDSNSGYVIANGNYPTISPSITDSGIDWVGGYFRSAGNKTSQFACDRWGQFQVDNSTTFKIHPNLLHCTSTFDVRAVLYDVSDPANPDSIETVVSFSQVDFNTMRVEGGYKAIVSWRVGDVPYTSGSKYSFTWYCNPDPTNYNGWVEVEGAGVDYINDGWPNDDVKADRNRVSTITGVDPTMFYKVEFRTASGTFIEGIMGPEDVIFVYDRAATLANPKFHDFDVYDSQSNYYYPQGDDTNHGRDPWHAVATMAQAFKLLDASGTYKTNRIVVMGFYHEYEKSSASNYFMHNSWWKKWDVAKPTTISGGYGTHIKGGILGLGFDASNSSVSSTYNKSFDLYLQKPMRWENLTLFTYNIHNSNQNCIYAQNHDFIMGKGVKLINFSPLSAQSGLATGVNVPNLTIVAGHYDFMSGLGQKWYDPIAKMDTDEKYRLKYDGNENENYSTIKILSGGLGRLIGASRNSGYTTVPAIYGTPTNPNRVRVEINIAHEDDEENEYLPDWDVLRSDGTVSTKAEFTHDIGIVVGGQTDGSTFSDSEFSIYNGHVSRYVSGNITFGRPSSAYSPNFILPEDAYFGRTVLNIYGGKFDELYGGNLGRSGYTSSDKGMVKAFFYGKSVINMYAGTVGTSSLPTAAKLFAAGAGGVIGKGGLWQVDGHSATDERKTYTVDDRIPFLKADSTTIEFRAFNEASPNDRMPKMNCIDSDGTPFIFDLTDSEVELNLYGGTVYGNVYGGGFGYASNLDFNRAPYRVLKNTHELQSLAGNLYGTSTVRLLHNPDSEQPDVVITGNVYGGGAGDDQYNKDLEKASASLQTQEIEGETYTYNFKELAKTFGDTHVLIEAGHVLGEVYGGGCGIDKYPEMANIYGNTDTKIKGGILEDNIYGGAAFSDIRKYTFNSGSGDETGGGNANLTISGGTIGNCVFGGGKGKVDNIAPENNTASNIAGDVYLTILGGAFTEDAVIELHTGDIPKAFNIYGGGYLNGTISGNTHVLIKSSLLKSNASINNEFSKAWNDILDRRFCVYGAGYGELTRVMGNTYVDIDIEPSATTVEPSINDIDHLVAGQTFFDVAGGGYSGNVGVWKDIHDEPIYKAGDADVQDYDHYEGGQLHVTVKGYPFIRKVIGGSFYAECNNTNTYLESGSVKEVYGGALMGYVHDNARLNIGSKAINGNASSGFDTLVLKEAAAAQQSNSHLFITGNVFGGNDVKGIVGTTFWTNDVPGENLGKRGEETSDHAPLFCSDVSQAVNKGVTLFIHGGTIKGNVYGAGNGHYRGYYVPDWVRYNDGPSRHYRTVKLIKNDPSDPDTYGKVYRCRPMTGSVTMHVGGNSATDRVNIMGNLYGGGRSCTIGQWNTILPYEDPRRLVKEGFLHINFGSHLNVNSVYMGAQGDDFMSPKELKKPSLTIGDGEFPETLDLDSVGDVAYDHWYLNANGTKYLPGFPPPGEVDGNYGMLGAHMLRGYAKNIEMNADIELTFYSNPFQLNADGTPVMSLDGSTVVCKKWLPAEKAHKDYDSSDLTFTNFFGGGASGFMTNNKLMRYNYTTGKPVQDVTYNYYKTPEGNYGVTHDMHNDPSANVEKFGTIYRFTLPTELTILDKVVGGSEDAIDSAYGYQVNADETITLTNDRLYTFEGGMVTQSSYTYDLIVHNDKYYAGYKNNFDHAIPAEHFAHHAEYGDSYTLTQGPDAGLTIYRWHIPENHINPNAADIQDSRYDLACYYDAEDTGHERPLAYCGPRESRIKGNETVLKLTVACKFDPQSGDDDPAAGDDHEKHFGGIVYGGCYNSGVTQGNVMVSVSSNTIGDHQDVSDPEAYGQISSLAHNIGRVFGGGYGLNSRVDGNTYVNLMLGFVGTLVLQRQTETQIEMINLQ